MYRGWRRVEGVWRGGLGGPVDWDRGHLISGPAAQGRSRVLVRMSESYEVMMLTPPHQSQDSVYGG